MNGFDDIDLCLRIGERGGETHYCPESVLVHLEAATRGDDADSSAGTPNGTSSAGVIASAGTTSRSTPKTGSSSSSPATCIRSSSEWIRCSRKRERATSTRCSPSARASLRAAEGERAAPGARYLARDYGAADAASPRPTGDGPWRGRATGRDSRARGRLDASTPLASRSQGDMPELSKLVELAVSEVELLA